MSKRFYCRGTIFAILLTSIFIPLSVFAANLAEEITITTYYPSPVGSYHELQLAPYDPSGGEPTSCTVEGTMYYNLTMHQLRICSNGVWKAAPGASAGGTYWQASVNVSDASKIDITNTNTGNVMVMDGVKIIPRSGSESVTLGSSGLYISTYPSAPSSSLSGLVIFGKNATISPYSADIFTIEPQGGNIEVNSLTLKDASVFNSSGGTIFSKPPRIVLGTTPVAGDVLTAKNSSGDVEWRAPSGGGGGGITYTIYYMPVHLHDCNQVCSAQGKTCSFGFSGPGLMACNQGGVHSSCACF